VLLAVLVSILGAAIPAQAQPAALASPSPVRAWLTSLWQEGISALRALSEWGTDAGPGGSTQGDGGYGIDPNG